MPNANNFALLDINYNVFDLPFTFEATTSTACHLWCYYTDITPVKHKDTKRLRGIDLPWGAYFCFVAWKIVEQQETGDTLLHTFEIPGWLYGETKYFTFKGTLTGVDSPSVGPIFKYTRPYTIAFPATLSSGFIRNMDSNYAVCHEAAFGDYVSDPGFAYYQTGHMLYSDDYYIYRMALMFDLAVFPPAFKPVAARLTFKTHASAYLPYDFVLVSGIAIAEPLTTADYGNIGYFTDSFGSTPCTAPWTNHQLDLNDQGVAFIRHHPTVRYGFRISPEVAAIPPPTQQLSHIYAARTPDRPWLHLAYLTH